MSRAGPGSRQTAVSCYHSMDRQRAVRIVDPYKSQGTPGVRSRMEEHAGDPSPDNRKDIGSPPGPRLDAEAGLPIYVRRFYETASSLPGIRGRVFIIGGTPEEAAAVRALGAEEAIVANPQLAQPGFRGRSNRLTDPHIQLLASVAEEVQTEAGSIDLILSTCVIEHILDIPSVLEKAAELLKPGGLCLIHGGPVWTADRGHHVWVQAADGTRYFFNGQGDAQPILPWEHLLFSGGELRKRLVDRGVPADHADTIIEHIYSSDKINRSSPTATEEMVLQAPLHCMYFKRLFGRIPRGETANMLTAVCPLRDLSTWAVEFKLRKPDRSGHP